MATVQRQWPAVLETTRDLYGRVWTDLENLQPWVVVLHRPLGARRTGGPGPELVFRGAEGEFALLVAPETRLEEMDDAALRNALRGARKAAYGGPGVV